MGRDVVKPKGARGTRDFLPDQMIRRQMVINTIKTVFETYGYEPLETPAIENLEVLTGKYGDDEKLIYKIMRRGLDANNLPPLHEMADLALRYDLTVPLCRVVAMYQHQLQLPFKRYQIQPVWRAERPQKGRYREFYQCDADAVGTASMLADAETLTLIHDVFRTLGFKQFRIRLNNRKILTGIAEYAGVDATKAMDVCIAIDKLDKIGMDGVIGELQKRGIAPTAINKIMPILEINGTNDQILNDVATLLENTPTGSQGVAETQELINYLQALGIPEANCGIDLYMARGLTYYTGPIYETIVEEPNIGSLAGGGRYDKLIGMFLGQDIPATGMALGIERIIDVMTELEMLPPAKTTVQVIVLPFNAEVQLEALHLIQELRTAGLNSEYYYNLNDKMGKKFKYAGNKGIPVGVVIGPDEIQQGTVGIKNLQTKQQETVSRTKMIAVIKNMLDRD
ncbi:MAG: histidine--tRNA ligase [Gemmatimonadetes bacterium]|nr:MAG: histidine--tRNA ligase [Gemmatimonadota bacterium]